MTFNKRKIFSIVVGIVVALSIASYSTALNAQTQTNFNVDGNASQKQVQSQLSASTDKGQMSSREYIMLPQANNWTALKVEIPDSGTATPLDSLRPHHVAISVPDFEETIRWYQEKLGFRNVIRREEFSDISTQAANLELNGFQIEIFTRDKSTRSKPPTVAVPDDLLIQGVKHIAFLVDDLDAVVAELKRRGVQLVDEPTRVDTLGLRLCFIRDNNGNLIELGQELDQKQANLQ